MKAIHEQMFKDHFVSFRYLDLLGPAHGPSAFGGGHMGPPPFGSGFPGGPMSHPPIGPGMPGPIGQAGFKPGVATSPTGHMPFPTMDTRPPVIGSKPPP